MRKQMDRSARASGEAEPRLPAANPLSQFSAEGAVSQAGGEPGWRGDFDFVAKMIAETHDAAVREADPEDRKCDVYFFAEKALQGLATAQAESVALRTLLLKVQSIAEDGMGSGETYQGLNDIKWLLRDAPLLRETPTPAVGTTHEGLAAQAAHSASQVPGTPTLKQEA